MSRQPGRDAFQAELSAPRRAAGRTQQELARTIALHPHVLSHKLNRTDGARLTHAEAKAIVRTLAAWQAISTRAEALELLRLAGAPASLSAPAVWEAPPFDALERTTAPPPLAAPRGELPTPATPLIGRDGEAALVARLFAGGARLVTLTGAGGAGKTRLALRSADDERRRGGEVAFAALAGLEDPREVPTTILRALGVAEVAGAAEADEDAPGCQSTSAPVGHPPACQHVTTL